VKAFHPTDERRLSAHASLALSIIGGIKTVKAWLCRFAVLIQYSTITCFKAGLFDIISNNLEKNTT